MSVNPTEYDLVQDGRLDDVESLVKNEYNPPSALEYSYPVVDQPMNDEMWMRMMRFSGMAIIDEVGDGAPFIVLSRNNASNTITIGSDTPSGESVAIINGVTHFLAADKTLPVPYPTAPTTYHIGSVFDPAKQQTPTGPISLEIWNAANPPTLGKVRLPHIELTWAPNQLLTDATVKSIRRQHSATIVVDQRSQLTNLDQVLWGTRALVWRTGEELIFRDEWYSITNPPWKDLILNADFKPFGASTPQYRLLPSGQIELSGSVEKKTGDITKSSVSYLGRLDAADGLIWARGQYKMTTGTGARPVRIETYLGGTGFRELAYYTDSDLAWLSLDDIRFRVTAG